MVNGGRVSGSEPPFNGRVRPWLVTSVWLTLVLLLVGSVARAGGPYKPAAVMNAEVIDSLLAEGWALDTTASGGENTRLISSSLAVLLGPFGAHRLYLGTTTKVAIIYGVTFGGFGILALVDLGHLLFTKDLDRYRNSDRVFMWSKPKAVVTPP